MNELSLATRRRVIKLFLEGLAYDDIALKLGISHGSVVNIIYEFREGDFSLTQNINEYIDTLRKLAVDIRKSDTSAAEVLCCRNIYNKVRKMGVDNEQVDMWLDVTREVASASNSGKEFASAALELAQLSSENGLRYSEAVSNCRENYQYLVKQREYIVDVSKELEKINQDKEQLKQELDALKNTLETARSNYKKQRTELDSAQNLYLVKNKLSRDRIIEVIAVVESGFSELTLSPDDIKEMRKRIVDCGSLYRLVQQLKKKTEEERLEINKLDDLRDKYQLECTNLVRYEQQLSTKVSGKLEFEKELNEKIDSTRLELSDLRDDCLTKIENLNISQLIMDFLLSKNGISNNRLDDLVNIFVVLRQKRIGIEPKRITDADGNLICECSLPRPFSDLESSKVNTEHARREFAHLLTPMVKDQFVSRYDYDLAEFNHNVSGKLNVLTAITETMKKEMERRRL